MKKLLGQIFYVENSKLPSFDKSTKTKGHYVFVSSVNDKKKTCDVNIITSLEGGKYQFITKRLIKVRSGLLYPIPFKDATFTRYSAANLSLVHNVKQSDLQAAKSKKISKEHWSIINKFSK